MLEPADIDQLLAEVRRGRALRVPFSTTLFADTRVEESTLRACSDGQFELTTSFAEFAAGHGWSCTQTEVEIWAEAQVRSQLAFAAAKEVELLPLKP